MNIEPDKLVEKYLDGDLTPVEQADLDRRLHDEPALRRELLQVAGMEEEIYRIIRTQAEVRRQRFWQRALPLGLAALLLLQIGGWLWLNRVGATRSNGRLIVVERTLPPVLGSVIALSGVASVTRDQPGDVRQGVVLGMGLRAGDRLQMGTNAVAVFRYRDGSQLRMYALSDLTLAVSNGAKRVWVRTGALDMEVRPQPVGQAMEVATDGLTTIVRGTEFRLLADDRAVWLGVRCGKVDVVRASDQLVVAVTDGQYVATAKGWPFTPMPTTCPYWQAQCVARTGGKYR